MRRNNKGKVLLAELLALAMLLCSFPVISTVAESAEIPAEEAAEEVRPAPEEKAEPAPAPAPIAEPKEEPKAEPKAEPKEEPKAEPEPAPKEEPKAEPEPAPKEEPREEPKEEPEKKPEPKKTAPKRKNAGNTNAKKNIDDGKIRACYEGGRSVSWIADEMKLAPQTVVNHLTKMGIYKTKAERGEING